MSLQAIEHYGWVSALLDDGSGARAEILAAAGLDEAGWQRLRAECLSMLTKNRAPSTAITFSRAYASARRQLAVLGAAPPPQSIAPVSIDGYGPVPDAEPRALDIDCTTDQAFPLAGPALPFRRATPLTAAQALGTPAASAPPRRADGAADVTAEAPGTVGVASPMLPFSAPTPTSRRQRLLHFEPSTGRRLSPPVWVDELELPAEPAGRCGGLVG
jgi:hypothetical protein